MSIKINGQHPVDYVYDRITASQTALVAVATYVWEHSSLRSTEIENLSGYPLAEAYVAAKNAEGVSQIKF